MAEYQTEMSLKENPKFSALAQGPITLDLITLENYRGLQECIAAQADTEEMVKEIELHYLPKRDHDGRVVKYGFAVKLNDQLAGLCLLGIGCWSGRRGYTGADTLPLMRGQGIAPSCKSLLFHLGFKLLGLNRIETGCYISNNSSRRSIEKTPGFQFEGTLREYGFNQNTGTFEDELRYAILRKDWLQLYSDVDVSLLP